MKLDLEKCARQHLGQLCDRLSGTLLYTGNETIAQNRIYVIGINPGGNPRDGVSLHTDIKNALSRKGPYSAYEEKNWNDKGTLMPHQHRVSSLLKLLSPSAHHTIPCSNLIFFRSRSVATLESSLKNPTQPLSINGRAVRNIWDLAEACWKVHLEIIKHVQPDLIVSLGNSRGFSPIQFIATKYAQDVKELQGSYKTGKQIEPFLHSHFGEKPVQVFGIAHPSFHSLYDDERKNLQRILTGLEEPLQKAI